MYQWLFRSSIISVAMAASIGLTACGGGGGGGIIVLTGWGWGGGGGWWGWGGWWWWCHNLKWNCGSGCSHHWSGNR